MTTFSRVLLSGSTNGKPIPVAATATPGTLIHAAVGGSSAIDEVHLYASNTSGAAVTLTVQHGGVTDPGDLAVKQLSIPANSPLVQIMAGQCINGGLEIRAFASAAGAINIMGKVNRIA